MLNNKLSRFPDLPQKILLVILFLVLMFPGSAYSGDPETNHRAALGDLSLDDLLKLEVTLVNVLGTHTHLEDEWMIGYQFKTMKMDGNRSGTQDLSVAEVHSPFAVAPLEMTMDMHMPMVMYAPTDHLTFMAMVPYIRKEMDHLTRTGVRFTTQSEGWGDLQLSSLYMVLGSPGDLHTLILNGGFSIPTGSIDKKDIQANPSLGELKLPYPMQLGSGTVDLLPKLTYLGEGENWAWGLEASAVVRLGENSNSYTLGDRYNYSTWVNWKFKDYLAPYIKIDGSFWENIAGADPDLNPLLVGTADPLKQAGERVDLSFGVNFYLDKGNFKGLRLGLQGGFPLYQSLDGPQLKVTRILSLGINFTRAF